MIGEVIRPVYAEWEFFAKQEFQSVLPEENRSNKTQVHFQCLEMNFIPYDVSLTSKLFR
jgi:hypothetical protein